MSFDVLNQPEEGDQPNLHAAEEVPSVDLSSEPLEPGSEQGEPSDGGFDLDTDMTITSELDGDDTPPPLPRRSPEVGPTEAARAIPQLEAEEAAPPSPPQSGPVRVRINRVDKSSTSLPPGNKPVLGEVIGAARRGEVQELRIKRDGDMQPIVHEATPSFVPPRADTDIVGGNPSESTDVATTQYWVRLMGERHIPAEDEQGGGTEGALNVQALLSRYRGSFELVIRAAGVEYSDQERLVSMLDDAHHDAQEVQEEELAQKLESQVGELKGAMASSAIVRREVVVGGPDPDTTAAIAELVASNVLVPPGREVRWAVPREVDGRIPVFTTEQDAWQSGEGDIDAYVSPERVQAELEFPTNEISGLSVQERHKWAVNRIIRPGTPTIEVGERLDNDGNVAGKFEVPVKDLLKHGLVVAETGAGKTYLLRELIASALVDNCRRLTDGEDIPPLKVVVIDQKKSGNYGQRLADMIAGSLHEQGIPQEIIDQVAAAQVIRPGAGGERPILDIFDPTGTTPLRQIELALNAILLGVTSDKETDRMLRRYIGDGIKTAYEKLGWDLEANASAFPGQTPAHPTMAMVIASIGESLKGSGYEAKIKQNLDELSAGQLRSATESSSGHFLHNGHPLDFSRMLKTPGVTTIELDLMTQETARNVTTVGIFRELIKAVEAEHGPGEFEGIRLLVVLDEALTAFADTETGKENAELLTHLRSRGVGVIFATQGDVLRIHPHARANLINTWALKVKMQQDRIELAGQMGAAPENAVDEHLAAIENEGEGLAHGDRMRGPVAFRTTNANTWPKGTGREEGAKSLIKLGANPKDYTGETIVGAHKLLREERTGVLITALAEMGATLVATGRDPALAHGEFLKTLRGMKGADATVRDSAIVIAATQAVLSRPAIMEADPSQMTPAALTKYLADHMLAQVHGDTLPPKPPEMMLDMGRYSKLKDALSGEMNAGRLPNSDEYAEALGTKIGGTNAGEQRDNLKRIEKTTLDNLEAIIRATPEIRPPSDRIGDAVVQRDLQPEEVAEVEERVREQMDTKHAAVKGAARTMLEEGLRGRFSTELLTRSPTPDRILPREAVLIGAAELQKLLGGAVDVATAFATVQDKLETRLKTSLSATQQAALNQLLRELDTTALRTSLGIPAMRKEIEDAMAAKASQPRMNLDDGDWREIFGADVDRFMAEGVATVADQLKAVEAREAEFLKTSNQSGTKVEPDLFFAPDFEGGGFTMDRVAGFLIGEMGPSGEIFKAQERAYNEGKDEDLSLIELLRRGDERATQWGKLMGWNVLLSGNFWMPPGARRYLVEKYMTYIQALRRTAEKKNAEAKKRQGDTNQGGA